MNMYGYSGKILRVDLTAGDIVIEEIGEKFYRRYLGGSGFICYFLLSELAAKIDPLGPANKLVFALGPLTGTTMPGSGRNGVGAKSPLTGGIALSQVGEFWGAELKRSGFDAIIVEGKSAKPVYLSIADGRACIRDAGHLWGKHTKLCQEEIRKELGDEKIRVAQIGPAGENMVPYSCIMNGLHSAAGRGGLGAVMGSKNLKAIAVRGNKAPALADGEGFKALVRYYREEVLYRTWLTNELKEYGTLGPAMLGGEKSGDLPVRNFRDGLFPGIDKITGLAIKEKIRVDMKGCFGCPVRCKKVVSSEDPYPIDPAYGGPEYEALAALGSDLGIDDLYAIAKANELCNAYGLDVISAGGTIAFAMECFEKGLLTKEDTSGLEFRFGSTEVLLQAVELIAANKGFGKVLKEGSARLARHLGQGSEAFAMHVKGLEVGQHEPRLLPSMGLGYMINPHGGDHCLNAMDHNFATEQSMDKYKPLGFLEPLPRYDIGPRKVALFKMEHHRQSLFDCLLLCHFTGAASDFQFLSEITAAATGWQTSIMELIRISERFLTMARLFNLREGFSDADDVLPQRFFEPKTDGALSEKALDRDEMDKAKRNYYRLMGWDERGVPLRERLEELEISEA